MIPPAPRPLELAKDLSRALRAGHPWVYRDAVATQSLRSGEIVDILHHGRFVARGYADAASPIAARVLTLDPTEAIDGGFFARRLKEAAVLRERFIDRAKTTAYRLLHGEGDFLPGFVCDLYGATHVLRLDGEGARALAPELVAALPEGASVYERMGQTGIVRAGDEPPDALEILEHGIRFVVDVKRGHKTGLFLDQRENRARIRALARGRSVLNCFSYTGGFALAAALGGATRTICIDTAAPALEAARENFARNGIATDPHGFVCEDAFDFLARASKRGERFGLVVLDPPSFAPNEQSLTRAVGAYRRLQELGLRCLEPGGLLATASCSTHLTAERFVEIVRDGAASAGRRLRILEERGAGPDHPIAVGHPEGRYLKFLLGMVQM